ncbi:uncharacterized protein LOC100573276 [Acyrthosiphon pisum]|uniref:Insulin-like domain-containing protein n=1 Tax=Acyrthosiphon pisum TaxID=7029 RepID=A0A8R2A8I6_ACYPI|nr:uncharacterized protein LOC100573276 [Acyrthosiphon pisum]|eukprot:XP_003246343.1 PREDICTED: uncharacterized protein LOC100573276 [Acyrthosiphon pisum]
MTKFTIVALVQAAVMFVMQVSVESCGDEFIKNMIVNVCGMGGIKRSFPDNSRPDSSLGLHFRGMVTDVEREFKHLVGDIEEVDLLLKTSNNKNKLKEPNVTPLWLRPINLPGFRDDRSRHPRIRGDSGKATIIKRELMNDFRECCNKNCSLKDLKRICGKK